jgi:hypothetical protein
LVRFYELKKVMHGKLIYRIYIYNTGNGNISPSKANNPGGGKGGETETTPGVRGRGEKSEI